jgi:hypothetical protein
MSSLQSARFPSTPADPASLVAAVSSVCERSFFAYVEPADAERAAAIGGEWYEADVAFDGPWAGLLRMAVPSALAHDLFASFIGCDPSDAIADAALEDLLGELANMTCGRWLTDLGEAECFSLAAPRVRAIDQPSIAGATLLAVNGEPVLVAIEPTGAY